MSFSSKSIPVKPFKISSHKAKKTCIDFPIFKYQDAIYLLYINELPGPEPFVSTAQAVQGFRSS